MDIEDESDKMYKWQEGNALLHTAHTWHTTGRLGDDDHIDRRHQQILPDHDGLSSRLTTLAGQHHDNGDNMLSPAWQFRTQLNLHVQERA